MGFYQRLLLRCFSQLFSVSVHHFPEKNFDFNVVIRSILYNKAKKYLKDGRILMIFPEGGRSKDGKLKKAYNGIALLALKSKVPVIPAGIIGADKVLPKGKYLPRFKRCEVKIGKPMHFNKFYNKKINKQILDVVTREIMKEIGKLIGQKYRY